MVEKAKERIVTNTLIIIYVLMLVIMNVTTFSSCTTQPAKAGIPEEELWKQRDSQRIINAYSTLLHRIWIDRPSYVEDVLWETDEMLELDELLNGEWNRTFEFWCTQDSIEYNLNWKHVDELTHM